ncbi:Syntaxin-7 [Chamberlinius hualienensis]
MAGYSSYHSSASYDAEGGFERLVQSSSSNIQKISHNVRSMQQMVNQIGTSQDTEGLRAELHKIQRYTNQLARDTNVYMKQLNELQHSGGSPAEQKQRKLQNERLTQEFTSVLNLLQDAQKNAARREKEMVAKSRAEAGYSTRYSADDRSTGNQLIQLESPVQNQMSLQLEQEPNLEMLREQEQAIRQIETDIVQVNQIFKDLAMMVHEQGGMIDSIEANIETASVQVSEATQQLHQASNYQTAARRKKCIIVLILAVVLAVVITIIVVSVKT